jgi:hypothetical protein
MSCDWIKEAIPLYHYGELPPEEEERFEHHVNGCETCRGELERHRRMMTALDTRHAEVPAGLLAECRHDLMRSIYRDEAAPVRRKAGAWASFQEGFAALFTGFSRFRQPLGAMALLALGWFSARLTTTAPRPAADAIIPAQDVVYSSVRSVQPDASGRVRIALDETRRRTVTGSLEDDKIRQLLLAAAREEDNPAVRVESMGILQPASADVRQVLLSAVLHDPSAAVRLKAVEALNTAAAQPDVRKVLAEVLMKDDNPGVRVRTIDLLTQSRDDSMVGVLQDVVQRESNSYVRLKCEKALKEMNASVGTF